MGRKKTLHTQVEIIDIADRGKSVGRTDSGKVIFVDGAIPGDVIDVLELRRKKKQLLGAVQHYHSYSKDRVDAQCKHFGVCGGCKWQHMSYEAQLRHKDNSVRQAFARIAKMEIEQLFPIKACKEIYEYRNKLEFTFSNKRWLTEVEIASPEKYNNRDALGFHRPGAFDKVVDIERCHLQASPSNEIRNYVREYALKESIPFFDIRNQEGVLRNMIVRSSQQGDLMLILSVFELHDKVMPLLDALLENFPEIKSLYYVINSKKNDSLLDQEFILYHGEAFIEEQLGDLTFSIGPKSFFQTNSKQALELYDLAKSFADLKGTELVYDLYTGLGSIALYVARSCKKVIGIETVASAIEDAKSNATKNGIENTAFFAGEVRQVMNTTFLEAQGTPDLVILDPPRAGLHGDVVAFLTQLGVPKIVYISCNPATQARDIGLMQEKYYIEKMQAVDMFPHTHHIENVALLKLK